jgi:serine/threonine protein kinase
MHQPRKTPQPSSHSKHATPAGTSGKTDVPPVHEQPTLDAGPGGPPAEPFVHNPAALVGQTFGDFQLLGELGRGGMGVVYKARQISLDRLVAVKMLLARYFDNPVVLARFLAEARAAASLTHPNIVAVYQVGQCAAGHFFAMELVEGRSLEALVQGRTIPVSWAVSLMIPVLEAVHYAHTKGIIHRDLKPANVMVDRHRRPVVMDFGIAKFLGRPSSLTQQGVIMGTPAFMPPEQADDDPAQVGPHSDIYSAGAILYNLLAGRPPYEHPNPLQTVLKVVSPEMPPPVRSLRPDVPKELDWLCMKCLSKRPADRYASAQAVAEELRRVRTRLARPKPGRSTMRAALPSAVLVALPTGKEFRIFPGTTVIGRSSECDVILRAAEVSKRHCRIIIEGDRLEVEDLGSVNGIAINDRSVQRAPLSDGDRLDVGGHLFEVRMPRLRGS